MIDIQLPAPEKEGGMTLRETLSKRRSVRSYLSDPIPLQTLSNLLWGAWGFSNSNCTRRTAPSSHNRQETELYIFLPTGVYIYDAAACCLKQIMEEDLRAATCQQEYAEKAPLQIALVSDTRKITGKTPQGVIEAVYANAGFICQNIYLAATAEGLATVARAMVDKPALAALLHLDPAQIISLVCTAGYYGG